MSMSMCCYGKNWFGDLCRRAAKLSALLATIASGYPRNYSDPAHHPRKSGQALIRSAQHPPEHPAAHTEQHGRRKV